MRGGGGRNAERRSWRLWKNLGNSMPWQSRAVVPRWRRKVTRLVSRCNQGTERVPKEGRRAGSAPSSPLAQPAAECVSGQNGRGRNSVRSEGALGRRTWPVAYRRDLRRQKKCPLKNFEFPPTQEPISSKPSRSDQSLQRGQPVIHRGFTGPTGRRHEHTRTHRKRTNGHSQRLSSMSDHGSTVKDE